MPSPFPGMDPFIEAANLWADFHDDLISEIKRGLVLVLPDRYVIRTDERRYSSGSSTEDLHRETSSRFPKLAQTDW